MLQLQLSVWPGRSTQGFWSQRKGPVKAQEGEGNSWMGIAAPAHGDVLQGRHASPLPPTCYSAGTFKSLRAASRMVGGSPKPCLGLPKVGRDSEAVPFCQSLKTLSQVAAETMLPRSWRLLPSPFPLGASPASAFQQGLASLVFTLGGGVNQKMLKRPSFHHQDFIR